MTRTNRFRGRSIAVVNDLSRDEQLYLYRKTHELKEKLKKGENVDAFRINDKMTGAYLIFVEPSTRTRESFLNAVKFHNIKTNIFDNPLRDSSFLLVEAVKLSLPNFLSFAL